jgi:hypothetical protein
VDPHSQHSSRREKILEAVFIGALLSELWRRNIFDVEVLRSDVDAAGYDLVLSSQFGDRHIQLKACIVGGKATYWPINGKLSDKPSGCVIVLVVDQSNLSIQEFLWFGARLGEPCSDIRSRPQSKHTKGDSTGLKSVRQDSFRLSKSSFVKIKSMIELANLLLETPT